MKILIHCARRQVLYLLHSISTILFAVFFFKVSHFYMLRTYKLPWTGFPVACTLPGTYSLELLFFFIFPICISPFSLPAPHTAALKLPLYPQCCLLGSQRFCLGAIHPCLAASTAQLLRALSSMSWPEPRAGRWHSQHLPQRVGVRMDWSAITGRLEQRGAQEDAAPQVGVKSWHPFPEPSAHFKGRAFKLQLPLICGSWSQFSATQG